VLLHYFELAELSKHKRIASNGAFRLLFVPPDAPVASALLADTLIDPTPRLRRPIHQGEAFAVALVAQHFDRGRFLFHGFFPQNGGPRLLIAK
jgi:hypothetical protein